MIKHLENTADFESLTKNRCLVDFYADWCGPCKMMGVVLEEIAKDQDIEILKINTDRHPELAAKFGVMSIPTIILMENSKEVKKNIGFMTKENLIEFLK
ncbi:MAG: thioredoxin [Bacilli bacterium]|nr:thioredoxin [Bacilli bacterium]